MFQKQFSKILFGFLFFSLIFSVSAQAKKKTAKKAVKKAAPAKSAVVETAPVEIPHKKNERPVESDQTAAENNQNNKANKKNARVAPVEELKSVYFYQFTQPDFNVSQIFIEHDENGKGKITFLKREFGETISDPIQLSAAALEKVKTAWAALDFLDSAENYQYEKDYSHLGNSQFTMRKDGRERTAKFNYTTNKDAKALADEYRKIGQQHIWIFDIKIARENYPLETPGLMDSLDSLVRRSEISDARQIVPFLQELSNDERLPLIARNHAARIIKSIQKNE